MSRKLVRTKVSLELLKQALHLEDKYNIVHVYQEDPMTVTVYIEGVDLPEAREGAIISEAVLCAQQQDGFVTTRLEKTKI